MGYKLADGSDSASYQVGDRFEVVVNFVFEWDVGDIVELYKDDCTSEPLFKSVTGKCGFYLCDGENGAYFFWENLKPYKKASFTISDLKDGMRVVYRNREERVIISDKIYLENGRGLIYVSTLSDYSDDLLRLSDSDYDIVKVYERDGTLLWERGEQTQAQQEYEELQKTIKELQNKADALGKLIK